MSVSRTLWMFGSTSAQTWRLCSIMSSYNLQPWTSLSWMTMREYLPSEGERLWEFMIFRILQVRIQASLYHCIGDLCRFKSRLLIFRKPCCLRISTRRLVAHGRGRRTKVSGFRILWNLLHQDQIGGQLEGGFILRSRLEENKRGAGVDESGVISTWVHQGNWSSTSWGVSWRCWPLEDSWCTGFWF